MTSNLLTKTVLAALIAFLAVLSTLAPHPETAGAHSFDPDFDVTLTDPNVDTHSDIAHQLALPEGDSYPEAMLQFTPIEFFVAGPGDVPIGARVGEVTVEQTLGLIDGPCNTSLDVHYSLLNAATWCPWGSIDFEDGFIDGNANGLPDGVDCPPDFMEELFPGITPRARYYGDANVSGVDMALNLLVFEPDTSLPGYPYFPSTDGYPMLVVFNDPTEPLGPGSITDFCSPFAQDITIYGESEDNANTLEDEGGFVVRGNPSVSGTYDFLNWARSLPDADDDGYENQVDTCPFLNNLEDIRGSSAVQEDPDGDAIDSACDYDPTTNDGGDIDFDGYSNRQDNCPFIADPTNVDGDGDGIGDICEGDDVSEDDLGAFHLSECDDAIDDDGDTRVNDGCPADGDPETTCDEERLTCAGGPPACDDDGDTVVNDGCPAFGYGDPDSPDGHQHSVTEYVSVEVTGPPVPCCPTPTSTATATPSPTPSPTLTSTPTPTPSAVPQRNLMSGWNLACYGGPQVSIEDAVAAIADDLLAVYSVTAGQTYGRWFPGRPDVSTITTLDPLDALLLLMENEVSWVSSAPGTPPASVALSFGWNAVCYGGETKNVEDATQGVDGQFAVIYALGRNGWLRHTADSTYASNLYQIEQYSSVLILINEPGGTTWTFDP